MIPAGHSDASVAAANPFTAGDVVAILRERRWLVAEPSPEQNTWCERAVLLLGGGKNRWWGGYGGWLGAGLEVEGGRGRRRCARTKKGEERWTHQFRDSLTGIHAVKEGREARRPIDRIAIAKGRQDTRVEEIVQLARKQGVPVRFEDRGQIDRLANSKDHQGVVALAAARAAASLEDILANANANGGEGGMGGVVGVGWVGEIAK